MNLTKFFLFYLLASFHEGYGQKKNEFAFVIQLENTTKYSEEIDPGATKNAHTGWSYAFGGAYERIFSKHSSGTIGVKYRKALNDIFIPVPLAGNFTDYAHFLVRENFVTIPVQYKYNCPIVSVSVGTSLDYFLSWKDERRYYYAPLQTYDHFFDKKLSIGLLGSISKKLPIDKNILLEPTLFYNPMLSFERTYFGGSLEFKYRL